MFTQTDPKWAHIEYVKGVTIGQYGCLITSLTNILCGQSLGYNDYLTPAVFVELCQNNNCFDSYGNLLWQPVEKFFLFKHSRVKQIFVDQGVHFIIQVPFQNTGHFCNVISRNTNEIKYFDVYDGKVKLAKDYISIRKIDFNKGLI
jgi:hypothetical protein